MAAVGEMLAQFHGLEVTHDEIVAEIEPWADSEKSINFLNSKETRGGVRWSGGYVDPNIGYPYIRGITASSEVWAVTLRNGEATGHAVLIYGIDEDDLILIKDPDDQTKYRMKIDNLFEVLSE